MSEQFSVTGLNRIKRVPKRADYDKEGVYAVVDAALICHVGMVTDEGQPVVIPTIHARQGDNILIHGATTSRMLNYIGAGKPLCITITHLDGLVLARSVFHHSMNYRSAVLYGKGTLLTDPAEKMAALEIFTEKLIPGRWADARMPNETETKATHIVSVPIDLASAKVRTGPPGDDEEDYALDVWAGVLPMHTVFGDLQADDQLKEGIKVPDYLREYAASKR
ncbi:MAG: pyridoxamine 5'-phosphate oxidase family protein [Anaerolineales bacterium]|nr:pyridoxamine 5'-phosphate oxidase family protein [Anaerolineales bacterium]